jgi:hypothetical protein
MQRIVLFLLAVFTITSGVQGQRKAMAHVPGEVLVQLTENTSIGKLETALEFINGKETGSYVVGQVSKPMHIWRIAFDPAKIDENEFLNACWRAPFVRLAQFNHLVENRATLPNDPNFGNQWQWVNNGGGGGTADADVDADEAWDITTGGITATGDTIVVAVLEGSGANYNHVDLIANHWRNYQEIPGNSLDDDGNGYVDDVNGWNTTAGNDVIGTGGHGTNVSGMIGAKGNNGIGVSGINWNVKIMQVDMGSIGSLSNPNEAEVIAAYTYPLVMRKLYNQTNGSNGAFVVATNASWGIDNGDPADAPLWCALYDTLGKYGVLNCGATTNSALNVDVTGDLPTACPSPYMISVTATNNQDIRTFSGYGQTTIDVAAPGADIYTTSGSSSYTSTSGTSFATPLTAGIIALMYSVNCPSFMNLVKTDPQAGADYIRTGLFASVDLKPNLTTETVTGGRVNAYNSVLYMVTNCAAGTCLDPYNLNTQGITTTQAYLTWAGAADSFVVRLRETGMPAWDSTLVLNDSLLVDTLMACTWYEFQTATICDGDTGSYSPVEMFQTDGCCTAPASVTGASLSAVSHEITWNSVTAATSYDLYYRPAGTSTWTLAQAVSSPHTIPVDSCTEYEYYVGSICPVDTNYTDTLTFKSTGCGVCTDLTYCPNAGTSSTYEWVESVQVGVLTNTSGNNNGYGDFTGGIPVVFYRDSTYSFVLTPGFSGSAYSEWFRIWVDADNDGAFGASEMLFDAGTGSTTAVSGNITIPASAATGITRMRIGMKYFSSFWSPGGPEACVAFDEGEVEDYCIDIRQGTGSGSGIFDNETPSLLVFPNPASDVVYIRNLSGHQVIVRLMDATGRQVAFAVIAAGDVSLPISHLAPGTYMVESAVDGRRTGVQLLIRQ